MKMDGQQEPDIRRRFEMWGEAVLWGGIIPQLKSCRGWRGISATIMDDHSIMIELVGDNRRVVARARCPHGDGWWDDYGIAEKLDSQLLEERRTVQATE